MSRIGLPPQAAYAHGEPEKVLGPNRLWQAPQFASADVERAFTEHLRAQVTGWSAVFHSVAAALAAAGAIWASVAGPSHDAGGTRGRSLAARSGVVLAQLAVAIVWAAARSLRLGGRRVELWSAASAGAVCAATLWVNPYHASVILGADSQTMPELWGEPVATAEGSVVLGVAVMAVGFGASVPIRVRHWPIVPLAALCSYGALLAAAGAQDTPGSSAFRAGILALLLVVMALPVRRVELLERAAWLRAGSQVEPVGDQGGAGHAAGLSANAYDLTFRLSETLDIQKTSNAVHAGFFGQSANGLSFTRFVARGDRLRFQELLDIASATDEAPALSCSLVLPQGPVQVALAAARLCADDGGGYVVGLRVVQEDVLAPAPPPGGPAFVGIVPQPFSERPPLAPGPPGVVTLESEGAPAVQTVSSGDSRRTNDNRLTNGSRGSNEGRSSEGRLTNDARHTNGSRGSSDGRLDFRMMNEGRLMNDSRPTYEGRPTNESRDVPQLGGGTPDLGDRLSGRSFMSPRSTPRRRGREDDRGTVGSWMHSVLSDRSWLGQDAPLWFSSSTDGRPTNELRLSEGRFTNEDERPSRSVAHRMFTMMRQHTTATGTQTEPGPTSVTTATNTNIVMEGMTFRCVNCSKPPKKPSYYSPDRCAPVLPGPEAQALIAKLDRKKRVRRDAPEAQDSARSSETELQIYCGSEFNGRWEVIVRDGDEAPNEWLQRFIIFNGKVLLGDGSGALLAQAGDGHGPVLLKGGELRLTAQGRLIRTGQSGVELEFYMMWECDSPPPILG